MLKRLLRVAIVAASVFMTMGIVYATSWDRDDGFFYDDATFKAWWQDTIYTKTSGYDINFELVLPQALAWVDGLENIDSMWKTNWAQDNEDNATPKFKSPTFILLGIGIVGLIGPRGKGLDERRLKNQARGYAEGFGTGASIQGVEKDTVQENKATLSNL